MEQHKSSMTALVSAFARSYHTRNDNPLIFKDEPAYDLIGEEQYNQIAQNMLAGLPFFSTGGTPEFADNHAALRWIVQTHLAPTPLGRARYCEDMLANALRLGVDQYVILGSGLDTFAFRNPKSMKKLSVFELDHPATQSDKQARIGKLGWELPENLHYIPIDFASQSLTEALANSTFDTTKRTFFSWLGVTYYLDVDTITAMLHEIAGLSRKGSTLVFDYPDDTLFSSTVPRVQAMLGMAQTTGEAMKSSFSYLQLESLLEKAGFLLYEHLPSTDIEERFFKGRKDYLHAFESVAYALAVVH